MQTTRVPPLLQIIFNFKREANPFRSCPMGRKKRPVPVTSFAEDIGVLLLSSALYGEDMGESYARAIASRRSENASVIEEKSHIPLETLLEAGLVKPVPGLVTDTFAFGKRENLVIVNQVTLLSGSGFGIYGEDRIFVRDPLFQRSFMSALNDIMARYGGNRLRVGSFRFEASCRPPVTIRRPGRLRPDFVRAHPSLSR